MMQCIRDSGIVDTVGDVIGYGLRFVSGVAHSHAYAGET